MPKADPSHALIPGTLIAEYRIEKLLGQGGFGLTYLAFDTHLEKQVAIKEYLPIEFAQRGADLQVSARAPNTEELFRWGLETFITEARTLARFHNAHIVQVYRFIEANGTAYIVMEYIPGRELKTVVRELGRLDQAEVMAILLPIMDGLAEVHGAGILHRDIKPANILIRDNGRPVLIDFGAARQAIGSKSRSITSIVTPGYAPIEQYSTKGNVGAWSDIYSLAAVAHYCLTLARPADATERTLEDSYVPLVESAREQGSPGFLKAIDQALAVAPAQRPQTLEAWLDMLRAEPAQPVSVSPDPAVPDVTRVVAPLEPERKPEPVSAPSNKVTNARTTGPTSTPTRVVGVERSQNRGPLIAVLVAVIGVLVISVVVLRLFNSPSESFDTAAQGSAQQASDPALPAEPAPAAAGNEPVPDDSAATGSSGNNAADNDSTVGATPNGSSSVGATPAPVTEIRELPAPPVTYGLYITTYPAGAEVSVVRRSATDQEAAVQPYAAGMRLAPGDYRVTATLADYLPASLDITVRDIAVREVIQLQPDRRPQAQAAFERARTERTRAAYQAYLSDFPDGEHREQVQTWLAELDEQERAAALERQREQQLQANQARRAQCQPQPDKVAGLTGRAYFDLGAAGNFVIRLGRFTVQPNAIKLLTRSDPHYALCQSPHCYEVRGPFGLQSFSVQLGSAAQRQGQVCFYHLDSEPHVYRYIQ